MRDKGHPLNNFFQNENCHRQDCNNEIMLAVIWLISLLQCASAENYTEKYVQMPGGEFRTKENRLLSFDTEEDGSIMIELAFNVPFLKIPVKRTMDMTKGAIANLNVGAVVLAAMMIFSASVFIPAVLHLMNKVGAGSTKENARHRSEDALPDWLRFLSTFDESLQVNNVNATSCMQRMACWVVKNSSARVAAGTASSRDKIIDGLASNDWINDLFVKQTIFDEAIKNGMDGINCSKLYNTCKITQRAVQNFLKQFANSINK